MTHEPGLAASGGSLSAAVLAAIDVPVLARLTVTCWQMGPTSRPDRL